MTPSALDKVWIMLFPSPAAAPLTFELTRTVHENVVPGIVFGLDKTMPVVLPEHMVSLPEVATVGVGLTTTLTLIGSPEQPLAVGVIV